MLQITFFKIPKRFQLLKTFAITFITFSFIVRVLLYFLSFQYIDFSLINLLKIFGIGFCYDIGALSYFLFAYVLYLLLIPQKKIGCKLDRIATKFFYGFFFFLIIFSFLAEIPFWREYQRRYNFIAVDYLLYTYEVIENIHQSFPLPALIMIIVLLVIISVIFAKKQNAYKNTFENTDGFLVKIIPSSIIIIFFSIFHFYVYNVQAEIFDNINEYSIKLIFITHDKIRFCIFVKRNFTFKRYR